MLSIEYLLPAAALGVAPPPDMRPLKERMKSAPPSTPVPLAPSSPKPRKQLRELMENIDAAAVLKGQPAPSAVRAQAEAEAQAGGEKLPEDIPPVAVEDMNSMLDALSNATDLAQGCTAATPLLRVLPSNPADEPKIRRAFDAFVENATKFKSPTPAQGVLFLRGVSDSKVQDVQSTILPLITAPASLQPLIDARKGADTKAQKRIQSLMDMGIRQLLGKDSTVPGILKRFKEDPDDQRLISEIKKLYEATTLSKDDNLTHALAILLAYVVFKGKIHEKDADGNSGNERFLKYLKDNNNLPEPKIPDAGWFSFAPKSPSQVFLEKFPSIATLKLAEKLLK